MVLVIALIFGLTGCFQGRELDFPVSETGFPIGFTRVSDGVQISLGMYINEVESIMSDSVEYRFPQVGLVFFDDIDIRYVNYRLTSVSTRMEDDDWIIAGEISVGGDIQSAIDSDNFTNLIHAHRPNAIIFVDDLENPVYAWNIGYNPWGIIHSMHVVYLPEFSDFLN